MRVGGIKEALSEEVTFELTYEERGGVSHFGRRGEEDRPLRKSISRWRREISGGPKLRRVVASEKPKEDQCGLSPENKEGGGSLKIYRMLTQAS